ncbi:DUF4230 domain-containing protein [Lacticaseibacillus camelliae]|uniref:DUF4230 domain-containing protein n=1 Tax=Lacticaseibacillus camelliae DSM 22697 = JCM 13995 TaxID=1423730 RepID=A0A0R2ER37_9LACO|nr:DUF4230 domain-containing protein [Lacticaseibacillus camelliae]KRN18131.1 hypothetical protein FC75_GL000953 [Lacticaseibacillus camelliae DSM 22697 = JCM 13995]
MKKMKKVIGVIVLIAVLVIGGLAIYTRYDDAQESTKVATSNFKVKQIGELDTTSVYYDKTVNKDKVGQILGGLIKDKETTVYIFHFKAQVYFDLAKSKNHYDSATKTLLITMPAPQVKLLLKDSDYASSFDYYKTNASMFVSDNNATGLKIQKEAAKDVDEDILGKPDIVTTAKKSAQQMLSRMLGTKGVKVKCSFEA